MTKAQELKGILRSRFDTEEWLWVVSAEVGEPASDIFRLAEQENFRTAKFDDGSEFSYRVVHEVGSSGEDTFYIEFGYGIDANDIINELFLSVVELICPIEDPPRDVLQKVLDVPGIRGIVSLEIARSVKHAHQSDMDPRAHLESNIDEAQARQIDGIVSNV